MAGSIPLALSQQVDGNGKPLAGAFLYFFQVGTVATLQNSYQDYGLTVLNPNPLVADQKGRFPMFWLADGQIHARMTDATGVVILDVTMQVLGPSSGGGSGGGSGVDPTAIFQTGDTKYRDTSEVLTGWVRRNGLTIGSAVSGATERANADTQNLFVYIWNNYTNAHCPVSGGRGSSGLADFNANKTIQIPDWRGTVQCGLDDMGNTAAGIIKASNITSGGGDGPITPGAWGGESNHVLVLDEVPKGINSLNNGNHSHGYTASNINNDFEGGGSGGAKNSGSHGGETDSVNITLTDNAGGLSHNNMQRSVLGTFYMKL